MPPVRVDQKKRWGGWKSGRDAPCAWKSWLMRGACKIYTNKQQFGAYAPQFLRLPSPTPSHLNMPHTPDVPATTPRPKFVDEIPSVLAAMLEAGDAKNREASHLLRPFMNEELVQRAISRLDPSVFRLSVSFPLEGAVNGMLKDSLPGASGKALFLFQHADFVEHHAQWLITREEGHACCADKSRTVLRALARYLVMGEKAQFDFTQEHTYHLPKRVLHTQAQLVAFFNAVYRLYYGNPEAYLKFLATVVGSEDGSEEA